MNTSRCISNISYNSPAKLEAVMSDLVARGVIDWAYWVQHQPDDDETKAHAHLVLKPSARIDTVKLALEFREFDPAKPDKPLCVTSKWRLCNSLSDWLLYAVHDAAYLASKGQRRRIHYRFEDIRSTDPDALREDWANIDRRGFDRLARLYDAAHSGVPFWLLVQDGTVPVSQRAQYEKQYEAVRAAYLHGKTNRIIEHESELEGQLELDGFKIYDHSTGEAVALVPGFDPAPNLPADYFGEEETQ